VWAVPDPEPTPETEPRQEDDDLLEEDDAPLRWYVIAAYMVAVVAGFALAVWLTASWVSACSDVGGKTTNVAGDSMRATLCESGHGAAGLLVPAGWVLGLVLATVALLKWGGRGLRGLLLAVLFVTPALLPAAAYAGLNRSGTQCPDDKLHAYREWVDAGSKGAAPYECRTF